LAGVGNLRPNTVLLEWRDEADITCYEDATTFLDRVQCLAYPLHSCNSSSTQFRVVAATEKALIVVKGANYLPNNQVSFALSLLLSSVLTSLLRLGCEGQLTYGGL
jgi:hypothetical protein